MPTPQTQAIAVANQIISLSQQLLGISQQMAVIDAAWSDDAVATTIASLATATLNADGSLGTADSSPNVAHPISNASLSRAVSSNQIAQAKTIMDGIVSYIGGQAVSTQVGARAILNAVTGG